MVVSGDAKLQWLTLHNLDELVARLSRMRAPPTVERPIHRQGKGATAGRNCSCAMSYRLLPAKPAWHCCYMEGGACQMQNVT